MRIRFKSNTFHSMAFFFFQSFFLLSWLFQIGNVMMNEEEIIIRSLSLTWIISNTSWFRIVRNMKVEISDVHSNNNYRLPLLLSPVPSFYDISFSYITTYEKKIITLNGALFVKYKV